MRAIRRQLTKEQFHLFKIPENFADEIEIIILAIKPSDKILQLSEEETFYAVNNNLIIEADENEDEIWSKYL
jgi:hypothetical protein